MSLKVSTRISKFEQWQDDLLLEGYFELNLGFETIAHGVNRNWKACKKRLWRLVLGRLDCANYTPHCRSGRATKFWTGREIEALKRCMKCKDREVKVLQHQKINHLVKILMRPEHEVQQQLSPDRGRGFGL